MTNSEQASGISSSRSPRQPERPFAAGSSPGLSDIDFNRLCRLIHEYCGIRIVPGKKTLLEGRIAKRARLLGFDAFHDYCDYLFSRTGMAEELTPMIDAVTTNKTDFFREPWHFEFLRDTALPALRKLHGAGSSRKLHAWSAACSSGEEPYTLAMVLSEFAAGNPAFGFDILATDISTRILEHARNAVYEEERVEPVPLAMRKKYLLRSRDRQRKLTKIAPELLRHIAFHKFNLMDAQYNIPHPMDIIFCRNVIIYFDRPTQEQIIQKLFRNLVPGGYLFTGHAETLTNMPIEMRCVGTTTYQKPAEGKP